VATLTDNKNGTVTLTLSVVEQDTLTGLPDGQLEGYVTLWLQERATQVFQERFAQLAPQDQADVLTKFRSVALEVSRVS
jgi:hypothetical protein